MDAGIRMLKQETKIQPWDKVRWGWCLAAVIFLMVGCTRSPEQRAIKLCKAATESEPVQPGFRKFPKKFIAKPLGAHSWLVSRHGDPPTSPLIIDKTYIVSEDKLAPYSLDGLAKVFQSDIPAVLTDAEQNATITLFIEMMDRGEATFASKVIDGVGDIYNYKRAPLSPVLEATIHPPRVEATPDGGKKHELYAHRVGNGATRRYEFTFNKSGQLSDVRYTEIGKGIGGVYLRE